MKILFYLPVITPWWFDNIVEPLIRRLAAVAEIHILAPPPWCGTGIGSRELDRCTDMPDLHWHIANGPDHPAMRTGPADPTPIIAFVDAVAPDYILCRSADCETARLFPGTVRYLMEAGASPFSLPPDWLVLQDQPFDHGCLPALDDDQRAELDQLIAPAWEHLHHRLKPSPEARAAFRDWAELPSDRLMIALPLEYEHEENFFPIHRIGARPNHRLIAELAATIDDSCFLAITNHPLNECHVDNSALEAEIASHRHCMRLLPSKTPWGESTTLLLTRDSDATLVGDSKSYTNCAFFGTPMVRRSRFKTGQWLQAYGTIEQFLAAAAAGSVNRAEQDDARIWFAFHLANNAIDPDHPDLTATELLRHLEHPLDPARWEAGIDRYRAVAPEQFA